MSDVDQPVVDCPYIDVTDAAMEHFLFLIRKEGVPGMNLRIFLDRPGVPTAEVGICFCPAGEQRHNDFEMRFDGFTLFIDYASANYLEEARVDYIADNLGGQLSITAPRIKGAPPAKDASLFQQVSYVLETEINPNLASHGGVVSLIDITPDNNVVLKFGGGCHGCGMVDVTLKQGIEKTLKERFPDIANVIDSTDHSTGENPYY